MNLNIKLQSYIKYFFFIICFLCYYTGFGDSPDFIEPILISLTPLLPAIGVFIILFCSDYKIKISPLFLTVLFISYILATSTGLVKNEILILIILVFLFSNENPRTFAKFTLIFYLSFLILSSFLSLTGIITNHISHRGEELRRSFSFIHPNLFGMFTLGIYTNICFFFSKLNKKNIVIVISSGVFITLLLLFYIDSRTSGLLVLLATILNIFYYLYNLFDNSIKTLIKNVIQKTIFLVPSLTFIFSLITTILYSPNNIILSKLNELFSTRLELQNSAFNDMGLPLFGKQTEFSFGSFSQYNYVDNQYLKYTYIYGLVFVIFLIIIISVAIHHKAKKSLYSITYLTIIWSLFAITEAYAIHFFFNPLIILLFNNYRERKKI